jgi:isopentenyl diphosphate isomerase/L-lactate dehydrogenase-like FMN-dependent dehydrogenase
VGVERALNIDEIRSRARRRLPKAIFDAIEGGAGDESTVRANRAAFERIWFRPRALADVGQRDLSTTVFGERISMPLMLAPCGMARMASSGAELAAMRAATRARTTFIVSAASSYTAEELAAAGSGQLWYQLYLPPDRAETEALLDRVAQAGYSVLCVTIDSPITPKRERDYRNGLAIPMRLTPKLLAIGLSKPAWTKDFLLGKVGRGQGFGFYRTRTAYQKVATTVAGFHPVTAEDVRWLRERWHGKLVIKGVQRGDECPEMVELGVDGIVVSNHGGRNLDYALGSVDVLPEVVAAVDGRAEVFVDGGFRRGADVVKAVALGAQACLVGRPYMFGLAAGAEAGVTQVLEIFRSEIDSTLALLGCRSFAEIDDSMIHIAAPNDERHLSPSNY